MEQMTEQNVIVSGAEIDEIRPSFHDLLDCSHLISQPFAIFHRPTCWPLPTGAAASPRQHPTTPISSKRSTPLYACGSPPPDPMPSSSKVSSRPSPVPPQYLQIIPTTLFPVLPVPPKSSTDGTPRRPPSSPAPTPIAPPFTSPPCRRKVHNIHGKIAVSTTETGCVHDFPAPIAGPTLAEPRRVSAGRAGRGI